MQPKRFIYILVSVLLVSLFNIAATSCSPKNSHGPTITVSIQPQKFLLEKIAGDKWNVKCLLTNTADPESYDPSLTHLLNLENSDAYFQIGNIPFESAIINKVQNNNPGLRIYNNSEGISLISGTHTHGNGARVQNDSDPHTWTSVKNAKKIAGNMLEALCELDPDNKSYYAKNFKSLKQYLDSLDNDFTQRLLSYKGRSFATWHPSLSYFARDYGLHQITFCPEGKEVPVQQLQESLNFAADNGAKVFFYQKDTDSRQAATAAEYFGADAIAINPLSYDWDSEMKSIVNAITTEE